MGMVIKRFDVLLVNLDQTIGSEIKKARPCVVISPDEANVHLRTVIVAPMTTRGRAYPTRVACRFKGKQGQIVLDQIRATDKQRAIRKLGRVSSETQSRILSSLEEMFAR